VTLDVESCTGNAGLVILLSVGKGSRKKKGSINEVLDNQSRHERELEPSQQSPSKVGLQKTTLIIKFIPILILLLVSFAVYFNALFGDFVYDDTSQVVDNPWIRDIGNIPTIFSKSVWSFQPGITISNYYRPLMYMVYMLNYHVFGLKPWGFHLVNILFHCGVSVLVFLVIRRLLTEDRASVSPAYLSPPFIAAMLFATHPIHTEAVTWIAGLPDVAFTFFYLLSFYLYVRSKAIRSGSYLFSVVCFAIAAFFKEPALTLPVIFLAYDYLFREDQPHFPDYLKRYAPYLVIALGYLALRIHALGEFAPQKRYVMLSAYQYVINVFPLFIKYLAKLLAPLNLNAFYVFHPIPSLFQLKGAFSLMTTVVFVGLFLIAFRKNKLVFLGLLFVVVPLLPVLYIPALGVNTFTDRYLYLPSVGYMLLLAVFLSWAKEKLPRAARSITIVFIVIGGVYSVGTINRNSVWQNNINLWSDTVRKSPDSLGAHNDLGTAYVSQGQLDRAIAEYQKALRLNPDYVDAHYNLGFAYALQGQLDRAITEYQATLRLRPNYADAHNNLGRAYALQGQLDRAIVEFQTAVWLKPDHLRAHYNLGLAYALQGQLDRAITEYQTALRLRPDFYEARERLNDIVSRRH
jgi:protein O-mannosyl-transferase